MSGHPPRKDGELSLAFAHKDLAKIVQLTKGIPVHARGSLRSILEVYQKGRARGITPLISAILHNNEHVAEMLIRETVDMGQSLGKGFRRITELEEFEALYVDATMQIIRGPTEDVFKDFNQTTPMFWALKTNNLYIVEKILNCPNFEKNSLVEKIHGMPALMLAVLENNIPACQILLKYKVDLHGTDFIGGKALDVAIDRKLEEMVRFLLTVGENANCKKHTPIPLIHAIDTDALNVLKTLIEKGANVQLVKHKNSSISPLHFAIDKRNFEAAKFLVKKGADVNARAREENEETPLQLLASLKLKEPNSDKMSVDILEMAKFLVSRKADVNTQNFIKETALHNAVNLMNVKLVKYLLSVNAQVNTKNRSLQTPLHAAIIPSNATRALVTITSQTEVSRHSGSGFTVNTPYVVPNQKEVVQLLIKYGAELNSKDCNLHTPLFLAVGSNNLEMVEHLIHLGAEVNGKNIDGSALLHFATNANDFNIVKCLVEVGKANVNVPTRNGDTPLHIAVWGKRIDIVECLINAKANANVENHLHATPFGIAVTRNSSKLVKLLAKAGGNVNTQCPDGSSFLHMALHLNHKHSAKSLIELGADVNIKDYNGVTPFLECMLQDFKGDFIQLMLDYGADPMHPCQSGLTVYQCAIARHEVDLLKMFWRYGCPVDEPENIVSALPKNEYAALYKIVQSVFSSKILITDEERALRSVQSQFIEGIIENKPKQVMEAIENGAVVRGVSNSLRYPLHYLAKNGYIQVAEVLMSNGAPVNSVDDNGYTPLEVAALVGNSGMCLELLARGACYHSALVNALSHYKTRAKQVDKEFDTLKKLDKKNESDGNLSTRQGKLKKMSKRSKTLLERNHIHKEYRKVEQEISQSIKKLDSKGGKVKVDSYFLINLFIVIKRLFFVIRKDRLHHDTAMIVIEECFENGTASYCKALLNSVDKKGRTLMDLAIEVGNDKMAQYLMNLRLRHPKMCPTNL